MKRRAPRRLSFAVRPLHGGAVALLVVLTGVLLVSIAGLALAYDGLEALRRDRERLSEILYLVGALGEMDASNLAQVAAGYVESSVIQRVLPIQPEATEIVERLTATSERVRNGAQASAFGSLIWRDMWRLYQWYGPYIEAHATTYARFLGFFAFGLAVAVSAAIASRSALRRIETDRRRARDLAHNRIEILELEHRSIMMELHDSVGQQLAAAQLRLSSIDDPAAGDCARILDDSRESIRRLARRLHPAELENIGLPSAIRQLGDDVVLAGGVAFESDLEEDVDEFIARQERIQVYRIVQEAVTNAMQHAHASRLGVSLMRAGDSVWLAVRDDGVGFEHTARNPTRGFGILSMTERANMVEGTLAVVSRPGTGTLVTLQMPARRNRSDDSAMSRSAD